MKNQVDLHNNSNSLTDKEKEGGQLLDAFAGAFWRYFKPEMESNFCQNNELSNIKQNYILYNFNLQVQVWYQSTNTPTPIAEISS